jgi:hypothetical protein
MGGAIGSLILAVLCRRYVLPESIREKTARILRRSRRIVAQRDRCEGDCDIERAR